MPPKSKYRKLGKILLFIAVNILFTAVVGWIAYTNRVKIKKWSDHDNSFSKEDKVLMYDIFSSPLIDNESELLLPPVKNSDDLINYLVTSTLPDSLDLLAIFDNCRVVSADKYRGDILRIKYALYNDTLESYAYFTKTNKANKENSEVIIYTSGTGEDRTRNVAHRLVSNEDPVNEAEQTGADIYFPIFPADDILAIHDGKKMLDIKKIASYLVSINRNIPLRYLANIFALEKYLRSNYSVVNAWGHSRGSITATITASIFLPDTLIANSGYAVSLEKYFRLGPDQMWWPHSFDYLNKNTIKSRLCGKKTKTFFLYGKKEAEDIYGLETWMHYTELFFKDCSNIKVKYTDKNHVWSSKDISEIFAGK